MPVIVGVYVVYEDPVESERNLPFWIPPTLTFPVDTPAGGRLSVLLSGFTTSIVNWYLISLTSNEFGGTCGLNITIVNG